MATYNITIEQGARWARSIVVDSDGTPWNLTGYDARMQIRQRYTSSTAEISLTVGDGITITAAAGQIDLAIGATDTAAFDFLAGHYDLELIPPAGEDHVIRLLEGTVTVSREVTR